MQPLDQRWSPLHCGEAALSRWLVRGQEKKMLPPFFLGALPGLAFLCVH